jgi:hypothetical protein
MMILDVHYVSGLVSTMMDKTIRAARTVMSVRFQRFILQIDRIMTDTGGFFAFGVYKQHTSFWSVRIPNFNTGHRCACSSTFNVVCNTGRSILPRLKLCDLASNNILLIARFLR